MEIPSLNNIDSIKFLIFAIEFLPAFSKFINDWNKFDTKIR